MNDLRELYNTPIKKSERTPEIIAAEIRTFTASMLNNIIEIGRRMCEAKELLPYGQFGNWIKENTGYSSSTANNFMRLYQEYGAAQGSLFGATLEDDQTFGKLNYSKALALLALPSEEREEFVEANDVESMSTRELKEAIRERDEAREQAAVYKDDLSSTQAALAVVDEENEDLRKRVRELESRPRDVAVEQPRQEDIDKAVAAAVEEINKTHASEMEKLRTSEEKKRTALERKTAAAEKAAKAAEEKAAEAGKDATGEAAAIRAEAERLRTEAEELRKKLAMSGEATVTFKLYFAAWQKDYANMMDALKQADEETADRLRAAVNAQIEAWSD